MSAALSLIFSVSSFDSGSSSGSYFNSDEDHINKFSMYYDVLNLSCSSDLGSRTDFESAFCFVPTPVLVRVPLSQLRILVQFTIYSSTGSVWNPVPNSTIPARISAIPVATNLCLTQVK